MTIKAQSAGDAIDYKWNPTDPNSDSYVYLHFAEIEVLPNGTQRKLYISLNGEPYPGEQPIKLEYLKATTVTTSKWPIKGAQLSFSISTGAGSDLPPILNGLEILQAKSLLLLPTNQEDVDAIMNIKKNVTAEKKDWQGDPCLPINYTWQGLHCSDENPPRIISFITGNFQIVIGRGGSGTVYHGRLKDGTQVAVKMLSPSSTQTKEFHTEVQLLMRIHHRNLATLIGYCDEGTNMALISEYMANGNVKQHLSEMVVVEAGKEGSVKSKTRKFTFSEIVSITGNFQIVIGRGGSGTVYHGRLKDGTQVAVKMLSPSSTQTKEFHTEVCYSSLVEVLFTSY
ncbi:unnamed protein product [Ilex paraguariensis]|uniref:Protein kinase domain-containing protein n=1 Tax=Ilex paraguariensis TaxID=185542 RepID=A0ABC8TYP1_9AQUA